MATCTYPHSETILLSAGRRRAFSAARFYAFLKNPMCRYYSRVSCHGSPRGTLMSHSSQRVLTFFFQPLSNSTVKADAQPSRGSEYRNRHRRAKHNGTGVNQILNGADNDRCRVLRRDMIFHKSTTDPVQGNSQGIVSLCLSNLFVVS
jgi:hypothetical protein